MADLSIFKLDSETITIKDTTARQAAESAKTLATTASGNATTALNKINELESEKADTIISSTSGAIASLPDGADDMPIKSLKVGIEPVQEGTGDPSPDNVRPITGWTGVNVTRTGKNLLNLVKSEMISSGWNKIFPISLKAGTYVMSCQNQFGATTAYGCQVTFADANDNAVKLLYSGYTFGDTVFVTNPVEITEEEAQRIKLIRFNLRAGNVTFENIFAGNIQLELGSTATDYEPYQGETYDITFPSEAGTVYGGSLDVTSGVLTVDRAQIASYAGETLPSTWISDRDVYSAGATPTTGAQVVYELAEPITYQLTAPEITTLLGQNNIWADTGDMSVKYRADTKLYIDNKFTELQALILENLEGETDHNKENMTITTGTHSVA